MLRTLGIISDLAWTQSYNNPSHIATGPAPTGRKNAKVGVPSALICPSHQALREGGKFDDHVPVTRSEPGGHQKEAQTAVISHLTKYTTTGGASLLSPDRQCPRLEPWRFPKTRQLGTFTSSTGPPGREQQFRPDSKRLVQHQQGRKNWAQEHMSQAWSALQQSGAMPPAGSDSTHQ